MSIAIASQFPLITATAYAAQQFQALRVTKCNVGMIAEWPPLSAFHQSALCKPVASVISKPKIRSFFCLHFCALKSWPQEFQSPKPNSQKGEPAGRALKTSVLRPPTPALQRKQRNAFLSSSLFPIVTSSDCDKIIGARYRDKEQKTDPVFIRKERNFVKENNRGLSPLQH